MSNNLAVQELLKKHASLKSEREVQYDKFTADMNEIESAIQTLSGKKVLDFSASHIYDDQRPDYIRGSKEEI